MNQKGFIQVILIILILIVAGGIVYFQFIQNEDITLKTTEDQCNLVPQDNLIIVKGKVIFPAGITNKSSYEVIGYDNNPNKINSDEIFCAYGKKGAAGLITVLSNKEENGFVLGAIINSANNIDNFVIDAKSTSVALIYIGALFTNNNPQSETEILNFIETNTDVIEFANQIKNTDNLKINDLEEGGRLTGYYDKAIESVLIFNSDINAASDKNIIDFEITVEKGIYNEKQLQSTISVIKSVSSENDYVKTGKSVFIMITEETKFFDETGKQISLIAEPKAINNTAEIIGYYDIRKVKFFAETIRLK